MCTVYSVNVTVTELYYILFDLFYAVYSHHIFI